MIFRDITSHGEMQQGIKGKDAAYVLLYKKGSELSECAISNIDAAGTENVEVLRADVSVVRDIHQGYGVTSAPTLLVFESGKLVNMIKGCHDKAYFTQMFEHLVYKSYTTGDRERKSVTVYATPTCSWCNTLKTYLRKNHISFREVNIASDPSAAEELVRKSGQQGVPQTEIDGQIVVGFDKAKLNRLLEIEPNV